MNFIMFTFAALIALAAGSVTVTNDATVVGSVVVTSSSVVFIPLHTTTYTASGTATTWTLPDFTRTDTTVYTTTFHTVQNITATVPDSTSSTPTFTVMPGIAVIPKPTATNEPQGPVLGTGDIIGICFGGIFAVTMPLYAIFLFWKRRKHDEVHGRSLRSQPRQDPNWNGPRQPISSPLSAGNLAQLGSATPPSMRAELSALSSPRIPPPRPGRPASLTESLQESMRYTPVAATRQPTESNYSPSLATDDIRHRSMSPPPLSIIKARTLDRTRLDTGNDTTAQLGAAYSQKLIEVPQQMYEHPQAQGNYVGGYQAQRPVLPQLAHLQRSTSTLRRTDDDIQLQDLDENDMGIREARRASAARLLDGDSRPDSPSHYDFAAARAARILDEKRIRAATPTPSLDGGSRISQSSAGPPPNFPLPPNPPTRPEMSWENFI